MELRTVWEREGELKVTLAHEGICSQPNLMMAEQLGMAQRY